MRSTNGGSIDGFSLVEALIASTLIASALVGLAHLVAIGAAQSTANGRQARAITVAQSKLEHLRRVAWRYGAAGTRVSSPELAPSPSGSLDADSAGYVDFVDDYAEVVAPGSELQAFVRRWSVAPIDSSDADTLTLRVCVFAVRGPGSYDGSPAACVAGIRTRKP